jgi:hypothetical protein
MLLKRIFKISILLIFSVSFLGHLIHADEWKKIEDYPNTQGYLGPSGVNIKYDNRLYKYYTEIVRNMSTNETIIFNVVSFEYQPVLYVRDQKGDIVQWGVKGQPYQEQGRWAYSCRLEFNPGYDGQFRIFHSSEQISQGTYWISGGLFRWETDPPPQPPSSDPKTWFPTVGGNAPRLEFPQDTYSKRVRAVYDSNTWIYIAWIEPGITDIGLMNVPKSYCNQAIRKEGNVCYTNDGIFIYSETKKAYVQMKVHDTRFAPMEAQFLEIAKKALAGAESLAVDQ